MISKELLTSIENQLSEHLKSQVYLFSSYNTTSTQWLSQHELDFYNSIAPLAKKKSWLNSRCALKKGFDSLQINSKILDLKFPSPTCSLTHSKDFSLAAFTLDNENKGIGVDLEFDRSPKLNGAKFFLTNEELEAYNHVEDLNKKKELYLKIWTIKEACFKAFPHNKNKRLKDFPLNLDFPSVGLANNSIKYAFIKFDNIFLSTAIF
ncbi:MAG: 4'-phosphopantetheinyl transferase superfamily protein [Bdellovibrionaceae bacterium]|jgi:hypothetical protein|nr:4'-phosphopantetheinyl transferase superfamily protein [Pseudobdellovibrionaceae bacterium]